MIPSYCFTAQILSWHNTGTLLNRFTTQKAAEEARQTVVQLLLGNQQTNQMLICTFGEGIKIRDVKSEKRKENCATEVKSGMRTEKKTAPQMSSWLLSCQKLLVLSQNVPTPAVQVCVCGSVCVPALSCLFFNCLHLSRICHLFVCLSASVSAPVCACVCVLEGYDFCEKSLRERSKKLQLQSMICLERKVWVAMNAKIMGMCDIKEKWQHLNSPKRNSLMIVYIWL